MALFEKCKAFFRNHKLERTECFSFCSAVGKVPKPEEQAKKSCEKEASQRKISKCLLEHQPGDIPGVVRDLPDTQDVFHAQDRDHFPQIGVGEDPQEVGVVVEVIGMGELVHLAEEVIGKFQFSFTFIRKIASILFSP